MTHVGQSYADWRAQYGNPLGLTHDKPTRAFMVRHIHAVAEEGMKGLGAGASINHPKVPIKTVPKVGDVNLRLHNNLELAALYYGIPDTDPDDWYMPDKDPNDGVEVRLRRVEPRDRNPQLSYYHRNRAKVRAYQARYKAKLKS